MQFCLILIYIVYNLQYLSTDSTSISNDEQLMNIA